MGSPVYVVTPSVAESLDRIASTLEAIYDVMERRMELALSQTAESKQTQDAIRDALEAIYPVMERRMELAQPQDAEFKRVQDAIQENERAEQAARASRQQAARASRQQAALVEHAARKPAKDKGPRISPATRKALEKDLKKVQREYSKRKHSIKPSEY